ncbi:MAG: rhodanese-like domain-containing protein [Parachlamydiaceae bacterium]|nr:rhodanese-like domain-containing protein [Parachlamydiaceae bacterium]
MKKILFCLLSSLCFYSSIGAVVEGERFPQSEEAVQLATYGHIDAKGLMNLIGAGIPHLMLDARGNEWHDGNIIPGALLAFYDYSSEQLSQLVPQKNTLVVVYCHSFSCPLSDRLAQKLVSLGYENVLEYPGGLVEWRDIAAYPIEKI